MQLINERVLTSLYLIVSKLFDGNRLLDRAVSVLNVKFVMNKSASIIHPKLAHAYPLLADKVGEWIESRNCMVTYLETPTDNSDYENPLALFQAYLDYSLELEQLIEEIILIAEEEKDRSTKIFLEGFLKDVNKYTEQAILLVDKCSRYECMMKFDVDIENFIIF